MDSSENVITIRKEKVKNFFTKVPFIPYIILAFIILAGFLIRIKNLPLLRDVVTGQSIPLELDPYAFLRYAEAIIQTGSIPVIDTLRYYPLGYPTGAEATLATYFSAYLYKFLHLFNPSLTLQYVNNLYPPIAFAIGMVFFFLLVKALFNVRVALLASAFLAVIPTYLYRTIAGFSDKEALAMALFFAALYFYVLSWKALTTKKAIIHAGISGIFAALMTLAWGGSVFLYLIIGATILISLALDRFHIREFYAYTIWLIPLFLAFLTKPLRFPLSVIFLSISSGILILAWVTALVYYLIHHKKIIRLPERLTKLLPPGYIIVGGTFIVGIILAIIALGPSFIFNQIKDLYVTLVRPFGVSRWSLTVGENHQPYVTDWAGQLGMGFIWLFIVGSICLFYYMLTYLSIKKTTRYVFTGVYAAFILSFVFSRYKPGSILNGESNLALALYVGSLIIFALFILYAHYNAYKKHHDIYKEITQIPAIYTLSFIFFIIMLAGARSGARLMFLFSPFISIFAAYAIDFLYVWTKKTVETLTKESYKKLLWAFSFVIIFLILFNPVGASPGEVGISKGILVKYYQDTSMAARYTGPQYNAQWQQAMKWVRENTPEDAVFAHWWDYGYWVQYGGRRATLVDGGNARGKDGSGAINHFIGRHVLTGTSDEEALTLLKAYNSTHLLIMSDDVGKYPAYSSIGADVNYDRYGYIPTFGLDTQQSREGRNGETILIYTGGAGLDHDIEYQGKIYSKSNSGIAGFQIALKTTTNNENITSQELGQPSAFVISSGQQYTVPLNCLYVNGQKVLFTTGLDACVQLIPVFQSPTQANPIGALLYLSPVVSKSEFTKLFLFEEKTPYFTKVYDDSKSLPLSIYQGQLIGPIKIWNISYPDNLTIPDYYYTETLPDPRVTLVNSQEAQ